MSVALTAEPTAALVIIGAEVLSGKVDDANGPFLIRALRARGIEVIEIRVIGDTVVAISQALRDLMPRVTHIFTTGGIGPTHDDVTMAGVAAAFDCPVVRHPELEQHLRSRYGDAVNEARLKLTEVPQGARVRLAGGGFIPIVQMGQVTVFPGVPSLMRACFADIAAELSGSPFHSAAFLLNASESDIAAHLTRVQQQFPQVAIGSYPRFDQASYRVKVTVDGRNLSHVRATVDALRAGFTPAWIVTQE